MKLLREDVYKALDTERDYQDGKWGHSLSDDRPGDGFRSIDEFALYIEGYTKDLVQQCSHYANPEDKLDIVRKVGALCVACMEHHGAPHRRS